MLSILVMLSILEMPWTRVIPTTWNSMTMINNSANTHNNSKLIIRNKMSSKEKVKEIVLKQAALARSERGKRDKVRPGVLKKWNLDDAYDRCVELAAKDLTSVITNHPSESTLNSTLSSIIKTLMLLLTEKEHLKAVAALAVWCRRTDELVDGSNRNTTKPETLQKWEQRLMDTFQGNPRDMCDAALYDTVTKQRVDIQLFKDMIEGMKIDLNKTTFETFDELYLYSYYATGTAVLMCIQVIGFDPRSNASLESLYDSVVSFAVALQVTDILRDISEDARMGRIYLPQDELESAGISNDDIINGRMTYKWRKFMKGQIERVNLYYKKGDEFITELKPQERWFFRWLSLLYKELLDNLEVNDYNFTKETSVGVTKQLELLLLAHGKSLAQQIFRLV